MSGIPSGRERILGPGTDSQDGPWTQRRSRKDRPKRPGLPRNSCSRAARTVWNLLEPLDDVPAELAVGVVVVGHADLPDLQGERDVAERLHHAGAGELAPLDAGVRLQGLGGHLVVRHGVDPGRAVVGVLLDERLEVLALARLLEHLRRERAGGFTRPGNVLARNRSLETDQDVLDHDVGRLGGGSRGAGLGRRLGRGGVGGQGKRAGEGQDRRRRGRRGPARGCSHHVVLPPAADSARREGIPQGEEPKKGPREPRSWFDLAAYGSRAPGGGGAGSRNEAALQNTN